MTRRTFHPVTNCTGNRSNCTSFGVGHNTHTVRATLAGTSPRGWRKAVVEEIDGLCLTVSYADGTDAFMLWHHRPLDVFLSQGSAVRLHDQQALLEVDSRWLSVAVSDVLG